MGGIRSKTGQGNARLNCILLAMMLREMMEGPCTIRELHDVTGLAESSLRAYLGAFHRRKVVHVSGWERDRSGKQSIRIFSFGDKPDAKKAPPLRHGEADRATAQRKVFAALRMAA